MCNINQILNLSLVTGNNIMVYVPHKLLLSDADIYITTNKVIIKILH